MAPLYKQVSGRLRQAVIIRVNALSRDGEGVRTRARPRNRLSNQGHCTLLCSSRCQHVLCSSQSALEQAQGDALASA